MREHQHLAVVETAQGDAEKIADAHIDRHAHAADGTMQDDAGTMQFDMADRSVGAGIMRLETNRK